MNVKKVSDPIRKYLKSAGRRRKALYVAGLAVILLAGGWYWYDQSQKAYVPPDFFEARNRAGEVSVRILQLTDASVQTLRLISTADEKSNHKRGLDLVLEEVDRNEATRAEAIKLSEELKNMAINLGAIRPEKAAQIGLQATTSGLELVQHLINYNNYTQELLGVLQTRLKSNGSPETRQRIEQIILRMNQEAEAVNELNDRYKEEMREFDQLTS